MVSGNFAARKPCTVSNHCFMIKAPVPFIELVITSTLLFERGRYLCLEKSHAFVGATPEQWGTAAGSDSWVRTGLTHPKLL